MKNKISKRNALVKMGQTGVLPSLLNAPKWVAPMVFSVSLPSHAMTSNVFETELIICATDVNGALGSIFPVGSTQFNLPANTPVLIHTMEFVASIKNVQFMGGSATASGTVSVATSATLTSNFPGVNVFIDIPPVSPSPVEVNQPNSIFLSLFRFIVTTTSLPLDTAIPFTLTFDFDVADPSVGSIPSIQHQTTWTYTDPSNFDFTSTANNGVVNQVTIPIETATTTSRDCSPFGRP